MFFQETEAIILRTSDYGESDRLVTFYTRSSGKLKGVAKGARRSRKRFVHAFEPGSLVELTYRERRSLIWIEGCKLLEPHLALRTEVQRWGYAALISEIMVELVPEGEPQEELFSLFKETLSRLSEDRDLLNVVLLFFIKFLDLMGYLPALEICSFCHGPLTKGTRWGWQIHEGTLICHKHRPVPEGYLMLDLGTLKLIEQVRQLPLDKMWRLHVGQDRKEPFLEALLQWVRAQIRKDLKSSELLRQVQSA
jgi:DNA repair protein RecO (recombination protein O)